MTTATKKNGKKNGNGDKQFEEADKKGFSKYSR